MMVRRHCAGEGRKRLAAAAMLGLCLAQPVFARPASAQIDDVPVRDTLDSAAGSLVDGAIPTPEDDPAVAAINARREETRSEYEGLARQIAISAEKRAELTAEVAALGRDVDRINEALVESASVERDLSGEIATLEQRLNELLQKEDAQQASLAERRSLLSEVLASLQRIGLSPPPALLVTPDDALASVRSSILLGAVVPEMREETQRLLADLQDLRRLRESIAAERTALATRIADQAGERARLSLLLEARRSEADENRQLIEDERRRAEELGEQATSLQALIDRLGEEEEAARQRAIARAEEAAKAAMLASLEAEREETEAAEARARAARQHAERLAALRDAAVAEAPNTVAAHPPFETMKGRLALPVAGRIVTRFGSMDDTGSRRFGDTVQTQSGSIVAAPAAGRILFAGRYRSFGQLLILDVGDGHHIVLGGMDRLFVEPSQTVLSGEPVGIMGETRLAAMLAFDDTDIQPQLYVEFRKDKEPVDPGPWWQDRQISEDR